MTKKIRLTLSLMFQKIFYFKKSLPLTLNITLVLSLGIFESIARTTILHPSNLLKASCPRYNNYYFNLLKAVTIIITLNKNMFDKSLVYCQYNNIYPSNLLKASCPRYNNYYSNLLKAVTIIINLNKNMFDQSLVYCSYNNTPPI